MFPSHITCRTEGYAPAACWHPVGPQDMEQAYNTIQYNTIQYNTIQYNTIQYNTKNTMLLDKGVTLLACKPLSKESGVALRLSH